MAAPSTNAAAQGPRIVVGVSDMAASNNPRVTLSTYALGSCVGVVGYDPTARAGGMLHFMLPDSALVPGKAMSQPAMFADTGLDLLLRALLDVRAAPARLRFIIAGGASMLGGYDAFKIGTRNVHAALAFFATHGFAPPQSIVGGQLNRTLHLDVATGGLVIKSPNANDTHSLA
jgi:chemotaxis protein CheD